MEKLVKYVARVSVFSRRKSETLIKAGKVKINNVIVQDLSASINSGDSVTIDNEIIKSEPVKLYIALNKPDGYISDLQDPHKRKLARDLIKINGRIFPVGRLDYHSDGLMIFTNDGDFANEIMHPKYGIEKEYLVKVKGSFSKEEIQKMKKGVIINGENYKIEGIQFVRTAVKNAFREKEQVMMKSKNLQRLFKNRDKTDIETKNTWYSITVNEGKNRMIRKIGDVMNHPVLKLKRVRIGKLKLDGLESGKYRFFEKIEALGNKISTKKKKNM